MGHAHEEKIYPWWMNAQTWNHAELRDLALQLLCDMETLYMSCIIIVDCVRPSLNNNNNENPALTATTNNIIDLTTSVGSSRQCLGP